MPKETVQRIFICSKCDAKGVDKTHICGQPDIPTATAHKLLKACKYMMEGRTAWKKKRWDIIVADAHKAILEAEAYTTDAFIHSAK